ncbi:steroid 21-hydroxylase isoform X1 [Tachysurus fulvidraco]|uniref:steroid 21-hydroxylase isoform X1 n=1 Tax=Tachysurus fulvidraco TaxID=1234273 RepID=UPI001FEEC2B0|nr:steroid 21-hydroxylase isoform X1 [Tachysurus fulvidraco]
MYSVTVSVGAAALLFILLVMVCHLVRRRNQQSNKDVKRCIQPTATVSKPLHCLSQLFHRSLAPSLPGPPSLPFLGNIFELSQDHLPLYLTGLARRYGNIYRLRSGSTTMVILNSSEVIREALVKKRSDFAGRPQSYIADKVSGGGYLISLGDYSENWKSHRRLIHSALQRCVADSLHCLIEEQALYLKQVLLNYKEKPMDLSEDFTVATSNIITKLAFGKSYEKSSAHLREIHGCLKKIVSLWGSPWISALDSFPFLRKLPNAPFTRLMKEVAKRDELIRGHLDEFKQKKHSEDFEAPLLQYLNSPEGKVPKMTLTDSHIHMTTVDLLIGGTETTAAWLSWTIAFLLHRPEVQNRVHEELHSVLKGQYPHYSDRHKLPYLCAVINEVLRLRPVAPLAVPHKAIRDSSIAGYFIPKNTIVIPNLFGAHHDPDVWPDPQSFRPERFLEGNGSCLQALIPFGGGARLCLGESAAKMEMFLFTGYLLRDFQFLPASPEDLPDLRGLASVVLNAKPYRVIACPRA